jgi:tRNA(Ser,Leu) C12 N-acetylase TAN1
MAPDGEPAVPPRGEEPAEAPAPPPAAADEGVEAAAPPTEASPPTAAAAAADGASKRGRDATGGEKQDKKRRKAAEEEVEAISKVVMKPGDAQALRAGLSGALVTCPTMHERRAVVHVTKALATALAADSELTPTATGCGGCFLLLGAPDKEVAIIDACSKLVLTTADPTGGRAARVFPVQATCGVTADALTAAAQRLTAARLAAHPVGEGETFTFAVLYHTRGHLDASDKLERTVAVKAVASGCEAACTAAGVKHKVNLSEPGAALMVDILPVTLAGGKSFVTAALALLPPALLTFRPKLAARPVCIGQ